MATYITVSLTPRDAAKMTEYSAKAAESLKPFDGEVVARGPVVTLSGASAPKVQAILRFPTEERAQDWYQSDAYQALIPLRSQAMDAEFHMISAA